MEPSPLARKALNELNFDFRAFTMDRFIQRIETARVRKLIFFPWKMPSGMFGAWMTDGDEPKEFIFYRDNVPLIHQIHIQLHELSHFLLGHPTLQITRKVITDGIRGDINLPFNDLIRLRSFDKTELEIEAETLASIIQEQVIRFSQIEQLTREISSDEKITQYIHDMGMV